MKRILTLTLAIIMALPLLTAQQKNYKVFGVAFYNLENLFDTINNNGKYDLEFSPNGQRQWDGNKYWSKIHNMAFAISRMKTDITPKGPAIIGVSEIENRTVLEDIVKDPQLKELNYQIIHHDSPDRRGVDVGFLYNPRMFRVLNVTHHTLSIPDMPNFRTRDQTCVTGLLAGEKISIIVNHWPSRYGGDKSKPSRAAAAAICKHIADSVCAANPRNKVIIVGDLNDDPSDESCAEVLGAARRIKDVKPGGYFNATWPLFDKGIGSLCYQDSWCLYDQQIISANFLNDKSGQTLRFWKTEVYNRDFLTNPSGKRKGYPLRSFDGTVWQNGYSDHFPTITYFIKQLK